MKAYTQTQNTQKTCVRVHSGSQRRNVKWQAAQSRLVVTWYMIFLLERRERGTWNLLILVFKSQGSDVEHGQKDKHAGSKDKHVGSPLAPCSLFSTTCWSCWSDAGTWTTTFNPNHKNKHQSWEQTKTKRAHDWATIKQAWCMCCGCYPPAHLVAVRVAHAEKNTGCCCQIVPFVV